MYDIIEGSHTHIKVPITGCLKFHHTFLKTDFPTFNYKINIYICLLQKKFIKYWAYKEPNIDYL